MPFIHITAQNLKTTKWSGGSTTELFIFPPTANYQQRDFDFRISTAKVEVEQSDFTSLPGYSRKLMVLNGSVTLHHEGHHSKRLNNFEVDDFEGDWKTSSVGKCVDFNLMTNKAFEGAINGISLEKEQEESIETEEESDWLFMYLFSGSLEISLNNIIAPIQKGDFVLFENHQNERALITAIEISDLVFCRIYSKAP